MKKVLRALKSYKDTYLKEAKQRISKAYALYTRENNNDIVFPGGGYLAAVGGTFIGFAYGVTTFSPIGMVVAPIVGAVSLFTAGAAYITGKEILLSHEPAKNSFNSELNAPETGEQPAQTNKAEKTPTSVPAQGSAASDFKDNVQKKAPTTKPVQKNMAKKAPKPNK